MSALLSLRRAAVCRRNGRSLLLTLSGQNSCLLANVWPSSGGARGAFRRLANGRQVLLSKSEQRHASQQQSIIQVGLFKSNSWLCYSRQCLDISVLVFFIFATSCVFSTETDTKVVSMYLPQSLLHRPLGLGMLGITKELIRRNLLKNPVGLLNLLSKCKSRHSYKFYFHCDELILANTDTASFL